MNKINLKNGWSEKISVFNFKALVLLLLVSKNLIGPVTFSPRDEHWSFSSRITVLENRIICCQIFCDLLLKSDFEQIFNVMQLILLKIR
jgi:hypothetical protein